MPSSRQFNNMSGAEQQTRPTEAAEDITVTRSAPGFAPWVTSTVPSSGGHFAQMSKVGLHSENVWNRPDSITV